MPHRGSPIADLFYPLLDGNASLPLMALVEQQAREFIENFGISIDGLRDLTTEVLTAFDHDYIDSNDVSYFWTAGSGISDQGVSSNVALLPTYEYMKRTGKTDDDKNNDGAVPLSSASHREAIGSPWLADHLDEVGHDLANLPEGTPKRFDYLLIYDEIIDRISHLKNPKKVEKLTELLDILNYCLTYSKALALYLRQNLHR